MQDLLSHLRIENFAWIQNMQTAKDNERRRWGCCCMQPTSVAHRRASACLAAAHVHDIHLRWRIEASAHVTTSYVKASYKGNGNAHVL